MSQRRIWQLLVEAVEVIDKSPDNDAGADVRQPIGWLEHDRHDPSGSPGDRTHPLLSAMKPYDGQTKYAPQRKRRGSCARVSLASMVQLRPAA